VGSHVATCWCQHNRHAYLFAQDRGGKIPFFNASQKSGAQGQGFEGRPIAPGSEHVHGSGVDGIPIVMG
jgi:hypothetical protein